MLGEALKRTINFSSLALHKFISSKEIPCPLEISPIFLKYIPHCLSSQIEYALDL